MFTKSTSLAAAAVLCSTAFSFAGGNEPTAKADVYPGLTSILETNVAPSAPQSDTLDANLTHRVVNKQSVTRVSRGEHAADSYPLENWQSENPTSEPLNPLQERPSDSSASDEYDLDDSPAGAFEQDAPLNAGVNESEWAPSTFLQGIARPSQDAELRTAVPGSVAEIHVREGDRVQKGDPLITLDNRVAQAAVDVAREVAQSKAALEQAEWDLKAAQSLVTRTQIAYQSQAASRFEVEAKQNQLEQATAAYQRQVELARRAEAELKLAEAELEQKTLRAPFDGEILAIKARIGNTITVEDIAVRIADLNHLQIEMHLPMQLLGRLKRDHVYELELRSPSQRRIPAFAEYISPVVEPTSGTFRVLFNYDNGNNPIPPGVELWFPSPRSEHFVTRNTDLRPSEAATE